jgi:hypothetical protein
MTKQFCKTVKGIFMILFQQMKISTIVCFLAILLIPKTVQCWGFYGHKKINYMAVFTLPEGMFPFFKKHIEWLTEHAVDADKRRYGNSNEAPRHYIDIDHYGEHPFDSVPVYWKDAVAKFSQDTLEAYGVVPWHIHRMCFQLEEAFKEGDVGRILYLAANMGHYVGDAHVPLHTTENYNGQLTNQIGIHGFWESRVPELYGDTYDYFIGKANYVSKTQLKAWEYVKESHLALDSVLRFEKLLSSQYGDDQKYAFEQRGNMNVRVYSQAFSKAYSDMLNGMQERRMRAAIIAVGSLWYTCWLNAGSPDLAIIDTKEVSDSLRNVMKEEELLWNKGVIKSRDHEH